MPDPHSPPTVGPPPGFVPASPGACAIMSERARQVSKGYTAQHDSQHELVELTDAAFAYGWESIVPGEGINYWPWDVRTFKVENRIDALTKAGAMIAAAIDAELARGTTDEA